MKVRIRDYSIRLKILLVSVLLLLLTSCILFLFFAFRFDKVYRTQANSHMADITSMSTVNITNMIEQVDQLSVSILIDQTVQDHLQAINEKIKTAGSENVRKSISADEAAISRQVRGSVFNIPGIISLRIYPREGGEIFIGTTNREYLEYSMTQEELYGAGGGALWGMAGEDHYICMGRSILSTQNMQPLGYLVIICKNEYLGSKLSIVPDTHSGKVYLVNEENKIMTSSETESIGSAFPYEPERLREKEFRTITDPATGEDSYYYMGNAMKNGWTLISTVSIKQFRNSIMLSILQMAGLLIFAVFAAFLITMGAIRRLLAPTGELLESMSAFGAGRLDSRVDVQGNDEIGRIGAAYNQMADNIQNLMEQVYSLELANKEAEIEFLKMQINPHFLYNSLDTISWLGYTSGNENISQISVSLAKLLRASIKRADMVTVREEMQTVESYLLIQQYRFEDKIMVDCKVDEEAKECFMPGFLLQPLIENSIIHGLEGQMENGHLNISILRMDEWLYYSVRDDGSGMEQEQLEELKRQWKSRKGSSIGLSNVYRRLQLLYGDSCRFQITSAPQMGTQITFRIPVRLRPENGAPEADGIQERGGRL